MANVEQTKVSANLMVAFEGLKGLHDHNSTSCMDATKIASGNFSCLVFSFGVSLTSKAWPMHLHNDLAPPLGN